MAVQAQESERVTKPEKEQHLSLKNLKKQLVSMQKDCVHCDLSKAKYFAMADGVPFELNSDEPLPFPKKWVKDAAIMQKLTGYEILLNIKEGKALQVIELMQSTKKKGPRNQ